MTEEEKQLLLVDLSARLPYGVCVHIRYKEGEPCYGKLTPRDIQWFIDSKIEVIKLYLRPLSSMTEEEEKEYEGFIIHRKHVNAQGQEWDIDCFSFNTAPRLIDWLNAHHFDYHGLIEKGLAIAVDENNNPYN